MIDFGSILNDFEIDDELGKFTVQYYKITMDFPDEIIIGFSFKNKINIISPNKRIKKKVYEFFKK